MVRINYSAIPQGGRSPRVDFTQLNSIGIRGNASKLRKNSKHPLPNPPPQRGRDTDVEGADLNPSEMKGTYWVIGPILSRRISRSNNPNYFQMNFMAGSTELDAKSVQTGNACTTHTMLKVRDSNLRCPATSNCPIRWFGRCWCDD